MSFSQNMLLQIRCFQPKLSSTAYQENFVPNAYLIWRSDSALPVFCFVSLLIPLNVPIKVKLKFQAYMHILLCQCQGNAWAVLIQCRHKNCTFGGLLVSRPVLISLQFLFPECAVAKKFKTLSSYFKSAFVPLK